MIRCVSNGILRLLEKLFGFKIFYPEKLKVIEIFQCCENSFEVRKRGSYELS